MQSVEDSIVRNYVLSFRVQCLVTLEAVRQIARYMQNNILLYIHTYFHNYRSVYNNRSVCNIILSAHQLANKWS